MKEFLKDNETLKNCKIYQMLESANACRHFSFHTPGHKVGRYDITELSFSDNLSAPKGCILEAEQDITRILGSKQSFILTDGSTSGIFSMLYAAKLVGLTSLAFPVKSHKSVYNACEVLSITPFPFETGERLRIEDIPFSLADGLLITSPDYYGNIPCLKKIRERCDRENKLFLIDGAHGGHLHFDEQLYAGSYADMWVDGVHKSLPSFTQGAVVSAGKTDLVEPLRRGVDAFRTTSPSYPIMASVEYAVKYPRNQFAEEFARNFQASYPERIILNEDWTKLCALFGENAFEVEKELEGRGVYAEFCDGEVIMFYLSPASAQSDLQILEQILVELFEKHPYRKIEKQSPCSNNRVVASSEIGEIEWLEIERAENRILAADCGLFPPCIPLIRKGDRAEKDKLELLKKASNVYGVREGKLPVVKRYK